MTVNNKSDTHPTVSWEPAVKSLLWTQWPPGSSRSGTIHCGSRETPTQQLSALIWKGSTQTLLSISIQLAALRRDVNRSTHTGSVSSRKTRHTTQYRHRVVLPRVCRRTLPFVIYTYWVIRVLLWAYKHWKNILSMAIINTRDAQDRLLYQNPQCCLISHNDINRYLPIPMYALGSGMKILRLDIPHDVLS